MPHGRRGGANKVRREQRKYEASLRQLAYERRPLDERFGRTRPGSKEERRLGAELRAS